MGYDYIKKLLFTTTVFKLLTNTMEFKCCKIFKLLSKRPTAEIQSRTKSLPNCYQKQNIKHLLQFQIHFLNTVPGPFKIFRASSSPNQIVEQKINPNNIILSYNIAHFIHILLFCLKVFSRFRVCSPFTGNQNKR